MRAIHDHIALQSVRYAEGVVNRITRSTERLSRLPQLGAEVPEYRDDAIRELLEYSYRIIYRLHPDRLEILSVIQGARLLPDTLPNGE